MTYASVARPVTQVEVEVKIAELTERLEAAIDVYAEACNADAVAEARWKRLYHTAVVQAAAHPDNVRGGRLGDAEARKGQAHKWCRDPVFVARELDCSPDELGDDLDPYAVHLIAAARREHAKEALRSVQSMLSAQQTLLRSISDMT